MRLEDELYVQLPDGARIAVAEDSLYRVPVLAPSDACLSPAAMSGSSGATVFVASAARREACLSKKLVLEVLREKKVLVSLAEGNTNAEVVAKVESPQQCRGLRQLIKLILK